MPEILAGFPTLVLWIRGMILSQNYHTIKFLIIKEYHKRYCNFLGFSLYLLQPVMLSNCSFNVFSDTFQEQQKLPLISSSRIPLISYGKVDSNGVPSNELNVENVQGADMFGTGLKNEVGEYNCFLNVIIQVGALQNKIANHFTLIVLCCSFLHAF